ncbi:hypothetical protein PCAR4_990016 [Paraburkholderia caribensis]|nr:hypothetical protein PCAR4_990016 [Paraburkholderia caribensis]
MFLRGHNGSHARAGLNSAHHNYRADHDDLGVFTVDGR